VDSETDTPAVIGAIRTAVAQVVVGKQDVLDQLLIAVLCRGHVLVEDVPGVGKTLLARSLAIALGCTFTRVQFTPDVLPSDVTGSSVFNQQSSEFEFKPGPIFTQILLADEINRATPRAQSALLEAMQEHQVTSDGHTRPLPEPFVVLATQNPVEQEGTFPLPEAQLDRFLLRVIPGYPSLDEEDAMLRRFQRDDPLTRLQPVTSAAGVIQLQREREAVRVGDAVREYILNIVRATREDAAIALGASPRASLALLHASQARALLDGRSFALPDDVKALAGPVLAHRLVLTGEARLRGHNPRELVETLLATIAVPVEDELVG
jgi:MoxR-like ATPase